MKCNNCSARMRQYNRELKTSELTPGCYFEVVIYQCHGCGAWARETITRRLLDGELVATDVIRVTEDPRKLEDLKPILDQVVRALAAED